MSRSALDAHVRAGAIIRVWHGVYALRPPTLRDQLAGLDLLAARRTVACMGTAAALYGFDTENDGRIHILDPGVRMRPNAELMVHQRSGAPLRRVEERLVTTPAWTAVEIARTLRRPRALATLDAALHCESCSVAELDTAVREQRGRRGIVAVRELLEHADGRAESPMESEARLLFIDGGLPKPELQFEIRDRCGQLWRVDFAWPTAMVVAEYDSMEWHASPEALKHDRIKTARLQECGYTVVPIVVDDVRRRRFDLVARIFGHLNGAVLAS
ncbi:hypothetical protein [Mycobacterium sp. NPDC050041]|uniref:hypothetical protein n=1 Tax=Mycobacterium sp. NPDC050041 TaxID=3364293 RepID=UPI003C2E4AD2